jgi:hypothetical protein
MGRGGKEVPTSAGQWWCDTGVSGLSLVVQHRCSVFLFYPNSLTHSDCVGRVVGHKTRTWLGTRHQEWMYCCTERSCFGRVGFGVEDHETGRSDEFCREKRERANMISKVMRNGTGGKPLSHDNISSTYQPGVSRGVQVTSPPSSLPVDPSSSVSDSVFGTGRKWHLPTPGFWGGSPNGTGTGKCHRSGELWKFAMVNVMSQEAYRV